MSISCLSEGEAPRDFRVSSIESDAHYSKCTLCYTAKKNFYCAECIRNGNFIHSSMPYSDKFSEKQGKLLQLRRNRQLILDRCKVSLNSKLRKDVIISESKQSRDSLDLLSLAIQQRRSNNDLLKKELLDLTSYNSELRMKLPRYQKRVSSLGKHAQSQRIELQTKISQYNDEAEFLAALRRSRIRQLTRYIFPVYISYDISDSIEDLEFVGKNDDEEPPQRPQLHIVAPWIDVDCDHTHFQAWLSPHKEAAPGAEAPQSPARRTGAALGLAAQLVALLAWTLDVRLPHAVALGDYSEGRGAGGWRGSLGRLRAGAAALCARAALPPAPPLAGLHALALAAAADSPALGRVEAWSDDAGAGAGWEAWGADEVDDPEPEHLDWPDPSTLEPEPEPPASLVTSAAASLVSLLRGWTK